MKKIYKFAVIIFLLIFSIILVGGIFDNKSQIMRANSLCLLIGTITCFCGVLLLYILFNKLVKKVSIKKEIILVIIISTIIIGILFFIGINLKTNGTNNGDISKVEWDLRIVVGYVNSYVNNSEFLTVEEKEYIDYTNLYNNSNGAIFVLIPIYKMFRFFGIDDELLPGIVFNIICIYLSLLSMYFIVRKIYDNKKALFVLFTSIFLTPVFLYAPVFYTDTLSMPFVIGQATLYAYIRKKENFSIRMLFIFLLSAVGFIIKPTVIFVTIAIFIDMIIIKKVKFVKYMLEAITVYLLILIGYNNIVVPKVFRYLNDEKQIPYTHFIMMGLHDKEKYDWEEGGHGYKVYGVFDYEDVLYTCLNNSDVDDLIKKEYYNNKYYTMLTKSNLNSEDMEKLNIKKINEIISNMTPVDFTVFLYNKLIQTWADGTCYVSTKLERGYLNNNVLGEFVRTKGDYFQYYFYISHFIHMSIILLVVIGGIGNIKNKNYDKYGYINLAILMLIALLCVWETRSRYILNYLPLLYTLTVSGIDFVIASVPKIKLPLETK